MAFKSFTSGAVLTAAEVNTYLMQQAVIVCTAATRPASPVEGMVIYETDTDLLYVYAGSAWSNILSVAAWQAWAPTLTQTGAVTHTLAYGKYQRSGRTITAQARFNVTGAGTAGSDIIIGNLPATAASSGYTVGTFVAYDASGTTLYQGSAILGSTTSIYGARDGSNFGIGIGQNPNFALANGDNVFVEVTYEAAAAS